MKTNFCGKCGNKLKESWNVCPQCGTPLSYPRIQKKTQENPFALSHRDSYELEYLDNPKDNKMLYLKLFGVISLLFGILSLFFGLVCGIFTRTFSWIILEIIFGFLAMLLGGVSLYKSEINYPALGGLILGGINLILFWYLIPFIF